VHAVVDGWDQRESGGASRNPVCPVPEDEYSSSPPNSDDVQPLDRILPPITMTSDTNWYEATFSVPWIVHGVATAQDAINIAVAELGKRVAQAGDAIRHADITVQSVPCSDCGHEMDVSVVVSGEALVGLLLTVEVQASCPEESGNIGQRELGPYVPDTPLRLVQTSG
jgi:uncharacterized protein (UPF0212 family)